MFDAQASRRPQGDGYRSRVLTHDDESFRHCRTKLFTFGSVKPRAVLFIVIIVVLFVVLLRCLRVVPAGHVGVVDLFGNVRTEALPAGLHFVNPLVRVHRMSVQTKEVKETMDTPSSEGLVVHLEVSINVLVGPNVRSAVREVTSSYQAKALYSPEREKMSLEINRHIVSAVEPRGIAIERMLLRDVALPPRLQQAIQEKLSAEQEAARMQFVLMKEKQEAERKKIEAEGISSFQKIVAEGINENLLKWKGIEATKELALSHNSKVVIIGSGKEGLPVILGGDTTPSVGQPNPAPHR
ncbi:MAG: membrane protease subunit, stomatin/prohibitin [Verrucomicrobia bacterium]|nr:MAG: membrane protease subunit, stomatin/prohibitin [Verrucomicrobiota bacterium]